MILGSVHNYIGGILQYFIQYEYDESSKDFWQYFLND